MDIQPPLVTNSQPTKAVEPCERTLNNPSVPPQFLAAVHASSGNSRDDASLAQGFSVDPGVVPFVCMQLDRALTWPTSPSQERRNGVNHLLQHCGICHIGSSTLQGERYSSSANHKMTLRAWFPLIRRVRSDALLFCLPFFNPLALTVCESKEALDQPISPASLRVSSSILCSFSHTPAFSQSRSLRQQVMPEPQPISCGSISHCKPDFSTNTMPVSAARLGIRGLPPFGLGGSGGKSGSITFHNTSDINAFAMLNFTKSRRFC
jgi:hypothetical protein